MSYFQWNTRELLSIYAQGSFPTKSRADAEFILFSPQRRALLPVSGMHISRTLSRTLRKNIFRITYDEAFTNVITECIRAEDNWITPDLVRIYTRAHEEGWAHSVECWHEDRLVGGLYGLAIGGAFFCESMFSLIDDASKVAMFHLIEECRRQGFQCIDVQFMSEHLESLGAYEVDQHTFRNYLETTVHQQTKWGSSIGHLRLQVGVPQQLSTERLVIRRFHEGDALSLSSWHQKSEVHRYTLVEPLANEDQARHHIQKAIHGAYQYGTPDPMAVCLQHDRSTVIGTIGCFKPIAGVPTFELAFDLDPKFWGKGLIAEAGQAFIHFMFKNYPVERLQSRSVSTNTASCRVLEKLGMKSEGTLRSAAYYRQEFWDMAYFSVLRSDLGREIA